MNVELFSINRESATDRSLTYTARVCAASPVLEGHFPGMPVVPGVCTLDMIKRCVEDAVSRPLRYIYVKECKFLSAIIPSQHRSLTVCIGMEPEEGGIGITAQVDAGGSKMMKLKARLAYK